ncbi:MAG: PEP-CTERM sorting domain-containing protein [Gemmatimonadaceae bacterium]|nr:PEP-CTERM sorting domain-containing protein [Gemmatimonadaceae bacterium]
MKKTLLLALSLGLAPAMQAQFVNGNFESGTTDGWTTGGGYRGGITNAALDPNSFLPGGANYSPSIVHSAVVGAGLMAHTDGKLQQVYSGSYSFRAEDLTNGGYASVISQRVTKYMSNSIFFAWAAVLEGAHDESGAAVFKLILRNETTGVNLIDRTYSAATSGTGVDTRFALSTDGYYYTKDWQIESLDVSAYIGNDFSLILLAADCSPTGHSGTVYLDGFGAVTPPPVDPTVVPEPASVALLGGGLLMLGGIARRRRRA